MTKHIYIASSIFAEHDQKPLEMIQEKGFTVSRNTSGQRLNQQELIKGALGSFAVIAGLEKYDTHVIEQLPQLRCISRCGVGVDNIDHLAAKQKGIVVFNTPDVVAQPVAELTIALIFDLLRQVTTQSLFMREKKWERRTGNLLLGQKVGIIGLGRIGRKVAELLRAWGIDVIGTDIRPDENWAQKQGVEIKPLEEVMANSDIITLHVTTDDKHPFCMGDKEISLMKKGAYLVNVARGPLINEASLIKALKSGHLAGAGLDVYEQEPYKGLLCDLDNVVLTPHVGTLTQESRLAMEIEAVQNILNFLNK